MGGPNALDVSLLFGLEGIFFFVVIYCFVWSGLNPFPFSDFKMNRLAVIILENTEYLY